jgi:hypothetical protein
MSRCHGNDEHCCVYRGVDCPFLEENTVEGRRWACALYRELQDWDLVILDKRYLDEVQPLYESIGKPDWNCRDYPQNIPEVMAQFGGKCCWNKPDEEPRRNPRRIK